ncbi:MAG: EpsG family protein [Bacteroidetes bacterium]|nr:EpsG family protein [Bacteroidota bacterium]
MIYVVILILLSAFAIRYDFSFGGKRHEIFWYNFVLWILIAVSGLRYKVGGDTFAYMDYFKDVPFIWQIRLKDIAQAQFEPLWTILVSISKSIVNDFLFLQILHAVFLNIIIFRFIRKNTTYRFTSVLIYYLFFYIDFNTEVMRESLSVCVFLLAYPHLKNKRWIKYYLYAALAFLFHGSAIVLFLIPFLCNVKLKAVTALSLIGLVLFIMFIPDAVKGIIHVFIFDERISTRFIRYAGVSANDNGIIAGVFLHVLAPAFIFFVSKRLSNHKPVFNELYFAYWFLAAISISFAGFGRFLDYLVPFMAIYFANMLNEIYRNPKFALYRRIVVVFFILAAFLPKVMYYVKDKSNIVRGTRRYSIYYPYYSVFDKQENYKREELYYGMFDEN